MLRSDNSSLATDCRKEIKSLNCRLAKLGPRDRAERRGIYQELRQLAKEERQRQQAAVKEVVKGAVVIASTLTGLLHPNLQVGVAAMAGAVVLRIRAGIIRTQPGISCRVWYLGAHSVLRDQTPILRHQSPPW